MGIIIFLIILAIIMIIVSGVCMTPEEQKQLKLQNTPATNEKGEIICSKCGSTQIHSDNRGWKMITGLIGSSQIMITCLKCGHKWKAGKR